jgi:hypothetical protein
MDLRTGSGGATARAQVRCHAHGFKANGCELVARDPERGNFSNHSTAPATRGREFGSSENFACARSTGKDERRPSSHMHRKKKSADRPTDRRSCVDRDSRRRCAATCHLQPAPLSSASAISPASARVRAVSFHRVFRSCFVAAAVGLSARVSYRGAGRGPTAQKVVGAMAGSR